MTACVQRLDPDTASRIAAGEVIERPASVVKELIDNAIDAGGTRIDIDLQNGGRRLIQVTDNGSGMSPEDAILALQRFTTSKIRCLDDLRTLTTLGFRGEALPSIAAVAEVDVYTRAAAQQEGVLVRSWPQAEPAVQPFGCPPGTRVCVRRLFASIPVRLRALRSISREVQRIQELVAQYALAHPRITFHLRHDGRRLLFTQACTNLMQRLPVVFGRELAAQMLPVHWQSVDMLVHGAVGLPVISRATRQKQYFWVNGRPVRCGLLSVAVERAYGALLPPGRHPLVALGVTLPPDLLEVNVHPRKTEVTFLHERAIFVSVQEAVEAVIQQLPGEGMAWQEATAPGAWTDLSPAPSAVGEDKTAYGLRSSVPDAPSFQPLGQVGNTYVVASGPQGLLLLDQHAAHERLIYDRLLAAGEAGIELEESFVLHLTANQQQWIAAVQRVLETLRFQLEPFGKGAMIVRAVPAALHDLLRPTTFCEALHEVWQQITAQTPLEEVRERLSASLACHTALRAGDRLSAEHMAMLIDSVAQQRLAYTCPHGRPTHLTLSLAELERRFLRFFPLDTSAGGC
jgi:DNA mismatch repair protein MutL